MMCLASEKAPMILCTLRLGEFEECLHGGGVLEMFIVCLGSVLGGFMFTG